MSLEQIYGLRQEFYMHATECVSDLEGAATELREHADDYEALAENGSPLIDACDQARAVADHLDRLVEALMALAPPEEE
jgi:ABC-type transporter Mla subunit MlaD